MIEVAYKPYELWIGISVFIGWLWIITMALLCWRIRQLKDLRNLLKQIGGIDYDLGLENPLEPFKTKNKGT